MFHTDCIVMSMSYTRKTTSYVTSSRNLLLLSIVVKTQYIITFATSLFNM
jgi:hypothetical protein